MKELRWAVFVSGRGTNLQNFLELEKSNLVHQKIAAVYADRECPAVERARVFGKPYFILDPKAEAYISRLLEFLETQDIHRIFLLGYMRILPKDFLTKWNKPIINLHPSLLPHYKGLNAIKRAYEAGEEKLGVSLHEVTTELDSGPLISQKQLIRAPGESFEDLEARIHALEREIVRDYLFDLESKLKASLG